MSQTYMLLFLPYMVLRCSDRLLEFFCWIGDFKGSGFLERCLYRN